MFRNFHFNMILLFIGYWICHCFSIIFTGKTDIVFFCLSMCLDSLDKLNIIFCSLTLIFLSCYMVSLFFQLAAIQKFKILTVSWWLIVNIILNLCIMPSIIIIVIMIISKNTMLMVQRKWKNLLTCIKNAVTIMEDLLLNLFFLSSKVLELNIALFWHSEWEERLKFF